MNNARPTIMSEVCHILCQQLQTNASFPSTASIFYVTCNSYSWYPTI